LRHIKTHYRVSELPIKPGTNSDYQMHLRRRWILTGGIEVTVMGPQPIWNTVDEVLLFIMTDKARGKVEGR
jgi:hypothetical protein